MRIVAIIQARMGSTRLPGKVLMDIGGQTMLARVVNRVRKATLIDEIVVATTKSKKDEPILTECSNLSVSSFRGSEEDVLDRYYKAALKYKAGGVVRITSDCPLIDPDMVDQIISAFIVGQPEVAYVSNTMFPRGLDTEVMKFDILKKAWEEDQNPNWREHVTAYIINHPELFPIRKAESEIDFSGMRWTVDTPEDLTLIRRIYGHFRGDQFSWRDVIAVLDEYSEWLNLNRHVKQKAVSGQ